MISEVIKVTVDNTAMTSSSTTKFNLYYQKISSGIVFTYLCEFGVGDLADTFSKKLSQSNMSEVSNFNHLITL